MIIILDIEFKRRPKEFKYGRKYERKRKSPSTSREKLKYPKNWTELNEMHLDLSEIKQIRIRTEGPLRNECSE